MATNKQEYEKIYFFLVISSYVILTINLFYYAQPVFSASGLTHPALLKIMLGLREGGIFRTPLRTKAWAFLLMVISHAVRSGKGKQVNWWLVGTFFVVGLVLYAVRPEAGYWNLHPWGRIAVDDRGVTGFRREENGKHSYLIPRLDVDELVGIMDGIVESSPYYDRPSALAEAAGQKKA